MGGGEEMSYALVILALVPSALSVCALIINIVLTAKKEARRDSDIAWETAKEITLRSIAQKDDWVDWEREELMKHFNFLYKHFLAARSGIPCKFCTECKEPRSRGAGR